MNLTTMHRDKCTLEWQSGHDVDGPIWTRIGDEIPCRVERHSLNKDKFQKLTEEGLSKASFPQKLDIQLTYRICLPEHDNTEASNFYETSNVQVCFDRSNRFIHSVIWF